MCPKNAETRAFIAAMRNGNSTKLGYPLEFQRFSLQPFSIASRKPYNSSRFRHFGTDHGQMYESFACGATGMTTGVLFVNVHCYASNGGCSPGYSLRIGGYAFQPCYILR